MQLPAGAKLTVEIGYRGGWRKRPAPASSACISRTSRRRRPATSIEIAPAPVSVAAGKTSERFRAETAIKSADRRSPRCGRVLVPARKSIEVTAIRPDGSVEPMLWVNNYRAEWPAPYILKEPIDAARGHAADDDRVLRQHDRQRRR